MKINGNKLKIILKAIGAIQQDVADSLGISRQTLRNRFKEDELDEDFVQKVKRVLDIDLELNESTIIVQKTNSIGVKNAQNGQVNLHENKTNNSTSVSDYNKVVTDPIYDNNSTLERNSPSIPMYNMPASASNIEMYGDPNDVKIVGYLNIPGASKDSFALPVQGHSMYPTLPNGVWGVVRPMKDRMDIEWGQVYYIEYGDYRVWKRLIKDEENSDNIILYSDNITELVNGKPKYGSKTIKADRISKLCLLTFTLIKNND